MASELGYRHDSTGKSLLVAIRNKSHQYWNFSDAEFQTLVPTTWSDFVLALVEVPVGGYLYRGDWPSELTTADWYMKEVYEQQGVSPAISDTLLAAVISYWNGLHLLPTTFTTIDGLDPEKVMVAVLATAAGKVTVTDNGDGTYTATFKRQDGSTTALSVTYNPATGTRAATAVIP